MRRVTVSEDSGFLEFRKCEGEVVWRGKAGATKGTMKIDLHSAIKEELLRFSDSGVTWFREISWLNSIGWVRGEGGGRRGYQAD